MDTKHFKELGFGRWRKMNRLCAADLPVREKVVFVIRERVPVGEDPSVIYVGRTGRPLRRILGGYVAGLGGRKVRKIHKWLLDGDLLSKTEISWKVSEDSRAEQKDLLVKLKEDGVVPPLNGPGKAAKAKPKEDVQPAESAGTQ